MEQITDLTNWEGVEDRVEFRVRPVVKYIVTKYTSRIVDGEAVGDARSEVLCECANVGHADAMANDLAHQSSGKVTFSGGGIVDHSRRTA